MAGDVKGMIADPDFQKLNPADQRTVLGRLDPDIGKLSDKDYGTFRAGMEPPAQIENSEGFWGGFMRSLSGLAHAPSAFDPIGWGKLALDQSTAVAQQLTKAQTALKENRPIEAVMHMAAMTPLIGPPLAHAEEQAQGTEAQYDKYGNVVKPGTKPSFAAGAGEITGMAAPSLIDVGGPAAAEGAATVGKNVSSGVKSFASKPGNVDIAAGTTEAAIGGLSLLRGNIWAFYPLARGLRLLTRGLGAKEAAKQMLESTGGHSIDDLNAIAHGDFTKLSEADQASVRSIADKVKNGLSPQQMQGGPPPGKIQPLFQLPPNWQKGLTPADLARAELGKAFPEATTASPPGNPDYAPVETPPPEAQPAMVPTRSLAQTEAAMRQKTPATPESPQSPYTATGERKSPALRGEELHAANRESMTQRYVDAVSQIPEILDNPLKLKDLSNSTFAKSQVAKGAYGWGNIADVMGEDHIPDAAMQKEIFVRLVSRKLQQSMQQK